MGRRHSLDQPRDVRRDAGYTLVEMLVAVMLMGALAAIVGSLAVHFGHVQQQQQERMAQLNLMNEASTMLDQDVRDATVLRKGTAHELDLLISRADPEDGQTRCADRDWVINPDTHTISLTSVVYEKPDCTGATAPLPTSQWTIPRVDVDTSTFQYTMRGQLGGHQINLANLPDGKIQNGHDIGEIAVAFVDADAIGYRGVVALGARDRIDELSGALQRAFHRFRKPRVLQRGRDAEHEVPFAKFRQKLAAERAHPRQREPDLRHQQQLVSALQS